MKKTTLITSGYSDVTKATAGLETVAPDRAVIVTAKDRAASALLVNDAAANGSDRTLSTSIVRQSFKNLLKRVLIVAIASLTTLSNVKSQNMNTLNSPIRPAEAAMREFYQRYIDAANNRDFGIIASMINDEVLINGKKAKKEESIAGFKFVIDNVPNHVWHIEDLHIDGERVAVRLRNTGTPKETSFYGQNPTGKSVEFTEFASYKIRNGRFVEMWYLVDAAKIREQLNDTDSSALDVVNNFFDRFKSGANPQELASFFDEKGELYIPGDTKNVAWIGKRTGRKEIADHFRLLKEYIQPQKLSFTDMVTKGNRVVVLGYLESLMKSNGNVMKSEFSIDVIVENGLITKYHLLEDSFEVSRAVNPSNNS